VPLFAATDNAGLDPVMPLMPVRTRGDLREVGAAARADRHTVDVRNAVAVGDEQPARGCQASTAG